ncbi:hypothetical protein [Emticicia sp. C21]|uniref:hypothetical protein n=1 Tax=Emticicia sp. C21 TaxID=2302915 RepID=UPI000E350CAB|nr:hypothetical protein [Emticicia sp. C21]RFS17218.1 hypothetical protein D0T08_05410 [Emticicia sp. C21]
MRLILIKIASIILILLLIDKLFGFFFYNYVFKKTLSGELSGGSLHYLIEKKKNVDFIIFGSSRAKHQIDPELISNLNGQGYNAGINGVGGVIYASVMMEIVLKAGSKPKVLILQLDSKHFLKSNENKPMKEINALYPFLSQSLFLRQYVEHSGWREKVLSNSDIYRYNSKAYISIVNYFKRNRIKDNNGFIPLEGNLDTLKLVKPVNNQINPEDFYDLKLKALKNVINTCKENNIKLYIVFPPEFIESINDKDFYNNKLKVFIYKESNSVRVIDMSNIKNLKGLSGPENWKDEDHFNGVGASKFSKSLNDSLAIY